MADALDDATDGAAPPPPDLGEPRLSIGLKLFCLSFAALFLELMLIRWVPSTLRVVAYYVNLLLISSFLGLGVGAMLSSRRWGSRRRCRSVRLGPSGRGPRPPCLGARRG